MKIILKRLLVYLIVLTIPLTFFGCQNGNTESVELTDPTSAEVSEHPLETVAHESVYDEASFANIEGYNNILIGCDRMAKLKVGYKSLKTQDQRNFYDQIARNVFSVSREVNQDGYYYIKQTVIENQFFSEAELRLIITAFTEDHPHVFWIADIFGYTNSVQKTVLQLYSKYGILEIQNKIHQIDEVLTEFSEKVPSGLSDYERETKIHDLLIDNCEYSQDITNINDDFDAFNIYGALVKKRAVCEGYSRTFQLLLSLAGIESVNIVGNEANSLHMWNAVKLDGEWYFVDTTWNDCGPYVKYDYYNLTTYDMIKYGHNAAPLYSDLSYDEICGKNINSPISFNLFVPKCTATDNCYINRGAVMLTGFSDYNSNSVIQKLYEALKEQKPFIEIYIDIPDIKYDKAVEILTNGKDGKIFSYIDSANNMYLGRKIDKTHISVIHKTNRNVLTIILNYV